MTRNVRWLCLAFALLAYGCVVEDERDFGDTGDLPYYEEPTPTPPPYDNIVTGTLGDRSIGDITSAYLIQVTLSCGAKEYMLWLSDYPFTCTAIRNSLLYGAGVETDDPEAVFGYLNAAFYEYDAGASGFLGSAHTGSYTVLDATETMPQLEDGDLVALPVAAFANVSGSVSEVYVPDAGSIEVMFVDRPDFFAGTFEIDFGADGFLDGEFNLRQCD